MANSIAKFKKYVDMLDEVYKLASLTSVLDGDSTLTQQGKNANEIVIPKMEMDGLADYSRNGGYIRGNAKITYQTKKFNYDRGRRFDIDAMDNEEIYLSTNTACSSGETSNAVMALYNDIKRASHTIRISLSSITTSDEIDKFLKAFDRNFESLNSLVRKD